MTDVNAASLESWQTWLAVEHEAVWLYGLIGGRIDDLTDTARVAWNRHRDTRDWLTARIRHAGTEPDGPLLSYREAAVNSVADARRAAQTIEAEVEIAALACISDAAYRSEVVTALRAAARAAADWGAKPSAFPGLSGRQSV
jgi:uncharacterized protein DUF4439